MYKLYGVDRRVHLIVSGIYDDDRLLIKLMQSAIDYMENIEYELPYDGVKEMLLVDKLGNKEYLIGLFETRSV